MDFQITYTPVIKFFARMACFIMMTWAITYLLSFAIGTIYTGHFPVYGIDPDPYLLSSPFLDTIRVINSISFLFSGIAFLAWPLLLAYLIINKVAFSRSDRLLFSVTILAILVFFVFKYICTRQFLWVFD